MRLLIVCFLRGWLTSTPTKRGVWKGGLSGVVGGEGTRAYAITLDTTQLHTTNQGDNSLRHPSNGVCGRESCQACGGEGTHANTTTQHFISDIHYTQHSRSQALRDPLTSTPIMWGVEGRVGRRVGGPQAKITRQHLLVPPFFYYTQTA